MKASPKKSSGIGLRGIVSRPARIALGQWLVALLTLFSIPAFAASPGASTNSQQIAAVKARMKAAILRVEQIVNQPVTELRRTPGMQVWTYRPGWFDPGAIRPDFEHVDIRKTQEFPYAGKQFVTSELNPGVVFLGSELEFNPMTKYFYTDRSVPKRRLTEAEMVEINKLYRVIGHCQEKLVYLEYPDLKPELDQLHHPNEPQRPRPLLAVIHRWIFVHKPIDIGIVAGLLVLLLLLRMMRSRGTAD